MSQKIILASRSPRRLELLAQIGITPTVMPADIDETVHPSESPETYVMRLAEEKARAVFDVSNQTAIVLAADTTVAIGDTILGKPADADEARQMLQQLSGEVHKVHTSVAVLSQAHQACMLNTTAVTMMPLDAKVIADYIATGEPFDKAGGYGIQGAAGAWVKKIDGSYTGVMGLPLYETQQLLDAANRIENR